MKRVFDRIVFSHDFDPLPIKEQIDRFLNEDHKKDWRLCSMQLVHHEYVTVKGDYYTYLFAWEISE